MTSALEQSQRLVPIIVGHENDQLEIRSLTLGKRGTFFNDSKTAPLLTRVNELNAALEKQLEAGRNDDDTLNKLLEQIDKLGNCAKSDFRTFKIDDKPEDWGKRRYILLMLGYVLLEGDREQRTRVVDWFKTGKKNDRMPRDPYWAATYIYDHIRFVDTHFRTDSANFKNYFSDPLLAYRVAGLAVQRGEFHKAIHELDTAVKYNFLEKFKETEYTNLIILNHARFERRCAQYHWWTYLSNRVENANELFDAIRRAMNVLNMTEADIIAYEIDGVGPTERTAILRHEQRSAALSFLLYSFHRFILRREGLPNWQGFSEAKLSVNSHLERLFETTGPVSGSMDKNDRLHFTGEKRLIDAVIFAQEQDLSSALESARLAIADFEISPGNTDIPGDRISLAREIESFLSKLYVG